MKKHLQHASSVIAAHYGLQWNGQTLTFNSWKSVGVLSNLFFVSVHLEDDTHLYLVDRSAVCLEDEGLRQKIPGFYFSPQMVEHLNRAQHPVWYVALGDELFYIKDRSLAKLWKRVNIKPGDDSRHRFDQDVLGSDIELKLPYIPGRGKVKKDTWQRHLKHACKTSLVPS